MFYGYQQYLFLKDAIFIKPTETGQGFTELIDPGKNGSCESAVILNCTGIQNRKRPSEKNTIIKFKIIEAQIKSSTARMLQNTIF